MTSKNAKIALKFLSEYTARTLNAGRAPTICAYVAFFIYPIFLNSDRTMKFSPYIVKIDLRGIDLAQMLDYNRVWFIRG